MPETESRRRRADGIRTRQSILDAATSLASIEGLEGLSIGRLAEHAGMSKSGLYAHFDSKQDLQLATIEKAGEIFRREVLDPAEVEPPGLRRILAQCDAYLSYLERRVFPGGCFFAATSNELAARRGPVADRIRELNKEALSGLVEQLRQAREDGDLDETVDLEQLAFELDALMLGAHSNYLLNGEKIDLERARSAVRVRLGA